MLRVDRCQDMDELINFEPYLDHSLDGISEKAIRFRHPVDA